MNLSGSRLKGTLNLLGVNQVIDLFIYARPFQDQFIYGKKMTMLRKGASKELIFYLDNYEDKILWISTQTKAFLIDLYFTEIVDILQSDQKGSNCKWLKLALKQFDEEIVLFFGDENEKKRMATILKNYIFYLKTKYPTYSQYFSNINKSLSFYRTEKGVMELREVDIKEISKKIGLADKAKNESVLNAVKKHHKIQVDGKLTMDCIDDYFKILFCNEELWKVYQRFALPQNVLDEADHYNRVFAKEMDKKQFQVFLADFQKQNGQRISDILDKYQNKLSFYDFCQYLYNSQCNGLSKYEQVDQEHPLTDYFCYSSHNTYLIGDQIQSDCKAERYLEDLENGVKCMEIDVHNSGGTPVVTHAFKGRGFCKPVSFKDVIKAIDAFLYKLSFNQPEQDINSHYPIILSIEDHTNNQNKEQILHIMHETFGSKLYVLSENQKQFPTLRELRNKIIIKTGSSFKQFLSFKKRKEEYRFTFSDKNQQLEIQTPAVIFREAKTVLQKAQDQFDIFKQKMTKKRENFNKEYAIFEQVFIPMSAMAKITSIFKCQLGVADKQSKPYECTSLTHVKVSKQKPSQIIDYTKRSWLRTYPLGTQIYSMNYNPAPMLEVGAQIIAINTQTKDIYAWMLHKYFNRGNDAKSHQTGYVLKPEKLLSGQNRSQGRILHRLSIKIIESSGYAIRITFAGLKEDNQRNSQQLVIAEESHFEYFHPDESFLIFDIDQKYRDCVSLRFVNQGYRIIQGLSIQTFKDCGIRVLVLSSLVKTEIN